MGSGSEQTSESGAARQSKFFKGAIVLYSVLDVEAVPVNPESGSQPDRSIKTFPFATAPQIVVADVAIAGGGMGAVAAALALGPGVRTVLTEETAWLGGQMTSQAVAALDENKYVESTGACANYLQMREAIRRHYRDSGNLKAEAAADPLLNPGTCWVTRLSFEPAVMVNLLDEMLAPQVDAGALTIMRRTKIVAAHLAGDDLAGNGAAGDNSAESDTSAEESGAAHIDALLAVNLDSGQFTEIQCRIAIDATEIGDLMPLAKIPFQTGSDSRWITGEPHAPEKADEDNVQDYTYPFVLTFHPGENHTIEKPADYDQYNAEGKFTFDGYKMFAEHDDVKDGKQRHLLPFWTYRRLIDKELFKQGAYPSDISMINWDSNDLRGKNFIGKPAPLQRDYLALAKRVSLGFLYWLQTEAARDDGGKGYPELKLSYDFLGTADGLSKYPYIRESRRLAATGRIVEQDIVEQRNPGARAKHFEDSCGIGLYPVDIHGHQEVPGAAQQTKPFQVPLGALITDYCGNYIAGCKNIGVTHITNGAYRLHPIEWAIGTAAGALARLALDAGAPPLDYAMDKKNLVRVQVDLALTGAPIFWFDDIRPTDKYFAAAQVLATLGIVEVDKNSLKFDGDSEVSATQLKETERRAVNGFYGMADWEKACGGLDASKGLTRFELAQTLFDCLRAGLGEAGRLATNA